MPATTLRQLYRKLHRGDVAGMPSLEAFEDATGLSLNR